MKLINFKSHGRFNADRVHKDHERRKYALINTAWDRIQKMK